MYRSIFWHWWRLKRRMRRAAVVVIRLGLVALLLAVAFSLLASIWPEAGYEARRFLAAIENTVRPVMERVADRFGMNQGSGPRRVSGWARAIDGDSLEVNGAEVRLHGIDAPEYGQSCRLQGRRWSCGREAKQALASQIRDKRVVCEVIDRDSYGRLVATCSIAGRDLNAWMVGQGWAFAYRRYSRAYVDEEARARAERRGVWMGEVVAPWKWRKGRRR